MSNVNTVKKQVETAQAELDTALAEGGDTTASRQKLKEKQAELSLVETKENQEAEAAQAEVQAKIQHEAGQMVQAAVDDLNARIEAFTSIDAPTAQLPAHLGANILKARDGLAVSRAEQAKHQARIEKLRQRQADLTGERAAIIARRADGEGDDAADAQRLSLLDADLEGLHQLIEREASSAPQNDAARSERMVAEAQAAFNAALRAEEISCLRTLVYRIEESLVKVATNLAAIPGIRAQDRYQPSPVIRKASLDSLL